MNSKSKKIQTAITIAPMKGWKNVELLKDCGLVPYLLQKNHNFCSTMIGAPIEEYPYLDTHVEGLKMEFLDTGSLEEKIQYILKNAINIDLLLCYGAYAKQGCLVKLYKQLNPHGKVYVSLDANSHWMDRIHFTEPPFTDLMNNADIIAASGHCMQDHLNIKWPWKIEYLPNGYYKFDHQQDIPCFAEKENIILTVGRLGTRQKATDVLLNAFAAIADQIPDWTLRLVGTIEDSFKPWINQFMSEHTSLAHRIQFTGVITDKQTLYQEYQSAKVFALTSIWEGGTPNVVAEALHAGCVMAVTCFDECMDAIDNGHCGLSTKKHDFMEFSQILLNLCQSPSLEQQSNNAYQYALRNYNMEHIVNRLYSLLYLNE